MTKFEFETIYRFSKNKDIQIENFLKKLKYITIFYFEDLKYVKIHKKKDKYIFITTVMHSFIDSIFRKNIDIIKYERTEYDEWQFIIPAKYIIEKETWGEEENIFPYEEDGKILIKIPKEKVVEVE